MPMCQPIIVPTWKLFWRRYGAGGSGCNICFLGGMRSSRGWREEKYEDVDLYTVSSVCYKGCSREPTKPIEAMNVVKNREKTMYGGALFDNSTAPFSTPTNISAKFTIL